MSLKGIYYKFSCFLLILIFFSANIKVNAQNFFYSEPIGNYPNLNSKIIGVVSNKIIVFTFSEAMNLDLEKPAVLIYDNEMRLLKKTSLNIHAIGAVIDFIHGENSFTGIFQYNKDGLTVCEMINFDADGNIINSQIIEQSNSGRYEVIKSFNDKTLVLVKQVPSQNNSAISLHYHFIKDNEITHSDTILLPFKTSSSTLGKAYLDNDRLIFPLLSNADSQSTVMLFKVNLQDNSSVNTIRNISNENLPLASIGILENNNLYTVIATWHKYTHLNKIFLWQLHKDLSDVSSDTVFTNYDTLNTCFQNTFYFDFNYKASKDNTQTLIFYPLDSQYISFNTTGGNYYSPYSNQSSFPHGFYDGRVISFVPSKDLNGNGSYSGAHVTNGQTQTNNDNNPIPGNNNSNSNRKSASKTVSAVTAFGLLNVDLKNNIKWIRCNDGAPQNEFFALGYQPLFFNYKNNLNIIYAKPVKGNKELLYRVVINADGSENTTPLISNNLKYRHLLSYGIKINANSLIIPCITKNKMALAKLVIQ